MQILAKIKYGRRLLDIVIGIECASEGVKRKNAEYVTFFLLPKM